MEPEIKLNVNTLILRFGNYVFQELIAETKKSEEEVTIFVPYTFSESTSPHYLVVRLLTE